MQVEVRIKDTDAAEAVRSYATRRIHFALGRFASRVGRVQVRVSDVNGTRGGADQCCHISAERLSSGKVVVEQVDANLFVAIDKAAERVGQAFTREIQRVHARRSR